MAPLSAGAAHVPEALCSASPAQGGAVSLHRHYGVMHGAGRGCNCACSPALATAACCTAGLIVGTIGGEAAAAPVAQKAAQAARRACVELTELILTMTGSQLEYGTLVQVPADQTQVGFCCKFLSKLMRPVW